MCERAALSHAFTLAMRAGRVPSKPYLPALKLNNVRKEVLDDEDVAAVLAELPEDVRGRSRSARTRVGAFTPKSCR
jgi:hypothetical protein